MKIRKIIGFDYDNVVADTVAAIKKQGISLLLKEFKEHKDKINLSEMWSLGVKYPVIAKILATGIISRDIREKDIMRLTEEDGVEFPTAAKFLAESDWWKTISANAAAVAGIEIFRKICEDKDYETHIISRRLDGDLPIIIGWLSREEISLASENIHLRTDISVPELEHKTKIVKQYGIQIFFDDLLGISEEIAGARLFESWPKVKEILDLDKA